MNKETRTQTWITFRSFMGHLIAWLLGYRPYKSLLNPQLTIWAKSRSDADKCLSGNSLRSRLPRFIARMTRPW